MTLHVAKFVSIKQLQHYVSWKHKLFQVHNCKYLHKGDTKDNNNNNNNNNNNAGYMQFLTVKDNDVNWQHLRFTNEKIKDKNIIHIEYL